MEWAKLGECSLQWAGDSVGCVVELFYHLVRVFFVCLFV